MIVYITTLIQGEPHEAIAKFRRQVEQIVGAVIQTKQPWFHGKLTRVDAEKRMNQHLPLKDGCFLVRERDQQGSYAVCLAHRQTVFHYLLDIDVDSLLSISNGRKFDTLLAVRVATIKPMAMVQTHSFRQVQFHTTPPIKNHPRHILYKSYPTFPDFSHIILFFFVSL